LNNNGKFVSNINPNTVNRRCFPHQLEGTKFDHCAADTFLGALDNELSDYWTVRALFAFVFLGHTGCRSAIFRVPDHFGVYE
jgi:hypothetical protein